MHGGTLPDEIKIQGKVVEHLRTQLRSATQPMAITMHFLKQWTHN
jgi:hypothetical protein